MTFAFLFIGRFQPFHRVHMDIVSEYAKTEDGIIIGIGSAQDGFTKQNPFTAGERYEMICAALDAANIDRQRVAIVTIPDINRYPLWVRHVETLCPKFSVVLTGNPVNKLLFREAGYRIIETDKEFESDTSGTMVRQLMAEKEDWASHVPAAVYRYVKSIKGDERIRKL